MRLSHSPSFVFLCVTQTVATRVVEREREGGLDFLLKLTADKLDWNSRGVRLSL